jgi:two-component system, NarL family, sensor kinase
VQAALSNIARHSGAREAWVSLKGRNGKLALEIRDNGKGFDAAAAMDRSAGDGIGLMGMHERAEHLNGSIELRSAPGQGTVVEVLIPLEARASLPAEEKVG